MNVIPPLRSVGRTDGQLSITTIKLQFILNHLFSEWNAINRNWRCNEQNTHTHTGNMFFYYFLYIHHICCPLSIFLIMRVAVTRNTNSIKRKETPKPLNINKMNLMEIDKVGSLKWLKTTTTTTTNVKWKRFETNIKRKKQSTNIPWNPVFSINPT